MKLIATIRVSKCIFLGIFMSFKCANIGIIHLGIFHKYLVDAELCR